MTGSGTNPEYVTGPGAGHDPEPPIPKEGGVVAQVGRLGVATLAGLVVADVILVSLAVGHVRGQGPASQADSPTAQGTTDAGSDKQKTAPPKPTLAPIDPAASRMLVDIGEGEAVGRAVSGTCGDGGAEVQMSGDGGVTFEPATSIPDIGVVLRLAVTDADNALLIGTDADCESVTSYVTSNGGNEWNFGGEPTDEWYELAEPGSVIRSPSGEVEVPCGDASVMTLSTLGTFEAYVLCDNGLVAGTADGGAGWTEYGEVAGAADLDFVDAENGLAVVAGHESCEGIAVLHTADQGETWEAHGCIETDDTSQLADISTTGTEAYVAAGEAVWYSQDGGESWEQRSP